jgi:hypothetical protein
MTQRPILTAEQIDAHGSFNEAARQRWQLVLSAASAVRASHGKSEPDLAAWNLLLMAAGNFKRQTPIGPLALPWPVTEPGESDDRVVVPDGQLLLRDSVDSWSELTSISGLGIPTSSTVLSALWPGHHAIMDTRALTAAVGLAGHQRGWDTTPVLDGTAWRLPPFTWAVYVWYRNELLQTAQAVGAALLDVERALYRIHGRGKVVRGRSWADYGGAITEQLAEEPT